MVDSSGTKVNNYSYDPYGISRTKTETIANPWQYTGGYLDTATDLYKFGIRYYDPTLGRFTQTDPTGQDPHYVYAANAPAAFKDATGTLRVNCGLVTCTAYFSAAQTAFIDARAFQTSTALGLALGAACGVPCCARGSGCDHRGRRLWHRGNCLRFSHRGDGGHGERYWCLFGNLQQRPGIRLSQLVL